MTDYFSHPALSQSNLKALKKSPRHFYLQHISGELVEETTDAMKFGTAFHTHLLEPQLFNQNYLVVEKMDKRTKEYKEALLLAETEHKTILTTEDHHCITAMTSSVLGKKMGKHLLLRQGQIEHEIYWTDTTTAISVECKAKIDFMIEPCTAFSGGLVIDIKTTINANADEFAKSIFKFGYHNQAAWYCDAFRQYYSTQNDPTVILIVVEKSAPYECSFFIADNDILACGRHENQQLLRKYAFCMQNNDWPGYPDAVQIINLPAWAQNQILSK